MTTDGTEVRLCACGCGEPVKTGEFRRGHFHRGRAEDRPGPLPGPEDEIDFGDLEDMMDVGDLPLPEGPPVPPPGEVPPWDELPPDEPPVDLGKPGKRDRARAGRPPKVTVTARKSIRAKIAIPMLIGGKIWEARDPVCGGTFVAQVPATAQAVADWVCESPDLVAWIEQEGGGFMHALNVAAALGPVAMTFYGHHISHTIAPDGRAQPEPDMRQYAA